MRMLFYFKMKYFLNMSQQEVDETEAQLLDAYEILLPLVKSGGKASNDELTKSFEDLM